MAQSTTEEIQIEENPDGFASEDLPVKKRGRPLGSKNAKTLLREAAVEKSEQKLIKNLDKIVKVVMDKAEEGDLTAAKMVWETFFKKATHSDDQPKGIGGITINVSSTEKNVTIESEKIEEAEYKDG